LIRAQIPAVVTQRIILSDKTTRAFASEFYQALAEGLPIDACLTEGRKAIMNARRLARPTWGMPVVYTRAPDGRLFDVPPTPKPRCPYPGMVKFDSSNAHFFYGRESEIETLLQRLRYGSLLSLSVRRALVSRP
jgi:hypothetical protein